MTKVVPVPVRVVVGKKWGWLSQFGNAHYVVSEERPKEMKDKFSFGAGHRVRIWRFKKNVHWKPVGTELEISNVPPAGPPRRRQLR